MASIYAYTMEYFNQNKIALINSYQELVAEPYTGMLVGFVKPVRVTKNNNLYL